MYASLRSVLGSLERAQKSNVVSLNYGRNGISPLVFEVLNVLEKKRIIDCYTEGASSICIHLFRSPRNSGFWQFKPYSTTSRRLFIKARALRNLVRRFPGRLYLLRISESHKSGGPQFNVVCGQTAARLGVGGLLLFHVERAI